jgi:hypothetical protein
MRYQAFKCQLRTSKLLKDPVPLFYLLKVDGGSPLRLLDKHSTLGVLMYSRFRLPFIITFITDLMFLLNTKKKCPDQSPDLLKIRTLR